MPAAAANSPSGSIEFGTANDTVTVCVDLVEDVSRLHTGCWDCRERRHWHRVTDLGRAGHDRNRWGRIAAGSNCVARSRRSGERHPGGGREGVARGRSRTTRGCCGILDGSTLEARRRHHRLCWSRSGGTHLCREGDRRSCVPHGHLRNGGTLHLGRQPVARTQILASWNRRRQSVRDGIGHGRRRRGHSRIGGPHCRVRGSSPGRGGHGNWLCRWSCVGHCWVGHRLDRHGGHRA
mmetsp:Transcript_77225/g.174690  ORF Transcript_77225/g.174690 Transcript_77225/m.174690 type:complete len:236 (+) Transcript_77225:52-759(+)